MKAKANDLGVLQSEVESAASILRAAKTHLAKAVEAHERAEKLHHAAQQSLDAAVQQLKSKTKVF